MKTGSGPQVSGNEGGGVGPQTSHAAQQPGTGFGEGGREGGMGWGVGGWGAVEGGGRRRWRSVHVSVRERHGRHALVSSLPQVGGAVVVVCEGQGVLLGARQAVGVGLQAGPLVIGEGHGEQRLGVTHKLVHIPLPGHLRNTDKTVLA